MLIKIIKEKINTIERDLLPQSEDLSDTQFKDAILLKYTWHVINSVKGILTQDNASRIENLKHFLKTNWEFVKGSLLAYTALPMHPVTELLCDIAKYVAETEEPAAINFLMPGIACDSLNLKKYGNLDEMDLTEVLQTHVLGKDSSYLIPISILAKEEINLAKIFNPYFDLDIHAKNSEYLSREELKRLSEHSSETTALYALREDYVALAKDKLTLLGKLNELIRGLGFYSVKGIGQEEVAGEGGYALLVNFIEFWNGLDKTDIPDVVKKEIDLITQLSWGKDKIGHADSCFATRKTELLNAITGNEGILEVLILSPGKKASGIEKTIKDLNTASADLQQCLKRKAYTGQDRLGITAIILDELSVDLVFDDFSALAASLKGLRAEDVSALCGLQQAPEKIVRAIANIENLVILASVELNDEVLSALLQGIQAEITSIIKLKEDFLALLIPLTTQQCKVVCNALKECMTSMVQTADDLLAIIRFLEPDQCVVVFKAFKAKLPTILKSILDLSSILRNLTSDQCKVVCEALKEKLSVIIKDCIDFSYILLSLESAKRTVVYEAFKEKLPAIIKSSDDFLCALQNLDSEQRMAVYESLKEKLPAIIKNGKDLTNVLRYLTSDQCKVVCESLKEKFSEIIKNSADFVDVLSMLTPEQRTAIYESLKEKLPAIIKNEKDLNVLCSCLSPKISADLKTAYATTPSSQNSTKRGMFNVPRPRPRFRPIDRETRPESVLRLSSTGFDYTPKR